MSAKGDGKTSMLIKFPDPARVEWNRYLREYADGRLNAASRDCYQAVIDQFVEFVSGKRIEFIASSDAAAFRAVVMASDLAPTTKAHRLKILRAYFQWLVAKGILPSNPMDGVRIPAARAPEGNALTQQEADALLRSPDRRTRWGRRDSAVLHVAVIDALRSQELRSLNLADVGKRYGRQALRLVSKGGEVEWVPLSESSAYALHSWIEVYPGPLVPDRSLFLSQPVRGKPASRLSARALGHLVAKHARRALIGRHVAPHALRRSAASIAHANGATIDEIRRLLRHKSLSATTDYMSGLLTTPAVDRNPLGKLR